MRASRTGRWARRPRRFDVVFYTPWIGSILDGGEKLPPGGAETQVLMLAKALAAQGQRVAIVVYRQQPGAAADIDGVAIIPRPPYVTGAGRLGQVLEVLRIWQSLWRAPSRCVVYRKASIELGFIAAYARLSGRRLVYSSANVIDFDGLVIAKSVHRRIFELGVRLAHAVVVQTHEQVELCRTAFGRHAALIRSLAPLADPQSEPGEAFLWVGRLVDYKRPLEYLALARGLPEARFRMVGVPTSGPEHRAVEQTLRAQAGELPNLELLPPRSHAEIGKLMASAVASVNTAEYEGMPNVLLEAWTRGVPALVLSHDPDGVVARYGLGGFAGGSQSRLLELAREQWETRAHRPEVATRCRAYIEANHAPDRVVRQWLPVLSAEALPAEPDETVSTLEPTCVG